MIEFDGFLAAAIMSLVIAIAIIYWDWRYLKRHHLMAKITGWLLVLAALGFWTIRNGGEFGVVFWSIACSIIAWGYMLISIEFQTENNKITQDYNNRPYIHKKLSAKRILHSLGTILMVAVVGLIACALFCLALSTLLPGTESNVLVFISFLFPVLWSLVSYWICALDKLLKPLVYLSAVITGSSLLLFL